MTLQTLTSLSNQDICTNRSGTPHATGLLKLSDAVPLQKKGVVVILVLVVF